MPVEAAAAALSASPPQDDDGGQPRPRYCSRSQSPLTVQSVATAVTGESNDGTAVGGINGGGGPTSVASVSVGVSILSTSAVAPARYYSARRHAAGRAALSWQSWVSR